MKNFSAPTFLAASLALLSGCASDALNAQGTAILTSTIAGQTPTRMGFDFSARSTTLEAGSGFNGSCIQVANRWEVDIARESPGADEFKRFHLSIPIPALGQTRESPQATFDVGATTFSASGTCVDSTTTISGGLHVVTRCSGVRATGDSRVIEADVNLILTNCAL